MSRTRLLLADDHTILRESLRLLIRGYSDFEVVAEASSPAEALKAVRDHQPDLICLDISMPGGSGIKLTERLRRENPELRILVLSMHDEAPFVKAAVAAGCMGYVLKSSNPSILIDALRSIRIGQPYFDPAIKEHAWFTSSSCDTKPNTQPPSVRLSERERQVLSFLAQGLSYAEISSKMFVSIKTVETYRTRLGVKLGLNTRADLVRYALETGILSPNSSDSLPDV